MSLEEKRKSLQFCIANGQCLEAALVKIELDNLEEIMRNENIESFNNQISQENFPDASVFGTKSHFTYSSKVNSVASKYDADITATMGLLLKCLDRASSHGEDVVAIRIDKQLGLQIFHCDSGEFVNPSEQWVQVLQRDIKEYTALVEVHKHNKMCKSLATVDAEEKICETLKALGNMKQEIKKISKLLITPEEVESADMVLSSRLLAPMLYYRLIQKSYKVGFYKARRDSEDRWADVDWPVVISLWGWGGISEDNFDMGTFVHTQLQRNNAQPMFSSLQVFKKYALQMTDHDCPVAGFDRDNVSWIPRPGEKKRIHSFQ